MCDEKEKKKKAWRRRCVRVENQRIEIMVGLLPKDELITLKRKEGVACWVLMKSGIFNNTLQQNLHPLSLHSLHHTCFLSFFFPLFFSFLIYIFISKKLDFILVVKTKLFEWKVSPTKRIPSCNLWFSQIFIYTYHCGLIEPHKSNGWLTLDKVSMKVESMRVTS